MIDFRTCFIIQWRRNYLGIKETNHYCFVFTEAEYVVFPGLVAQPEKRPGPDWTATGCNWTSGPVFSFF
jgi:hypothetical protein